MPAFPGVSITRRSTDVSPETADDGIDLTPTRGGLKFPISDSNEIGNWITFSRKKYQKIDMFEDAVLVAAENSRTISLPVPAQLDKTYAANWENDTTMGAWSNFLRSTSGEFFKKAEEEYKRSKTTGVYDSFVDTIKGLSASDVLGGVKNAAQVYGIDMFLGSEFFRKTGAFSGMARNPFTALLFTSPTFRSFNPQYKLVAKNFEEALAIRDMIREFQVGMSPSFATAFENNVFSYPDLFTIEISKPEFLYKFKPSALRNISVNYHAEGFPAYIKGPNGEKIPSSIQINLEFQETVLLTRKDFEEDNY